MFIHFLTFLSDGEPHHTSEIREYIASEMKISKEDQKEMIPSGQSTRSANRVGWGRTHLSKAGLIERVDWGIYRISEEGEKVLSHPPDRMDIKFLNTIPKHKKWVKTPREKKPDEGGEKVVNDQPPNERIEEAYRELKDSVADELIEKMGSMDPYKFEQLVVDLLFSMGYGGSREEAATVTQKSNDGGIDGIINEDRLGLDVIYIQAKRYQATIGRKEIQSFVGALAGKQANKGVFITTSDFKKTATDYAKTVTQKVILINGSRLADLMIEHDIGVSTQRTISIKRIDTDYFEEV